MSEEKLEQLESLIATMQAERVEEAMSMQNTMKAMEDRMRMLLDEKEIEHQLRLTQKNESVVSSAPQSESGESEQQEAIPVNINDKMPVRSFYKPARPPLFSGESHIYRPRAWRGFKIQMSCFMKEVILAASGEHVEELRKVDLFIQNLTTPAIIIASTIRSRLLAKGPLEMISLDKFITALDKLYLRKNVSSLYEELFKIQQTIGESTEDYFERFSNLLAELLDGVDIPRDVAVNWFSNGLLPILREKLAYRRGADSVLDGYAENQPEEAVDRCFQIALAEETTLMSSGRAFLLKKASSSSNGRLATSTSNNFKTGTRSQEGQTELQTAAWRAPAYRQASAWASGSSAPRRSNNQRDEDKKKSNGPLCFNCRERGHFARECTSSKKSTLNNMYSALSEAESEEEATKESKK